MKIALALRAQCSEGAPARSGIRAPLTLLQIGASAASSQRLNLNGWLGTRGKFTGRIKRLKRYAGLQFRKGASQWVPNLRPVLQITNQLHKCKAWMNSTKLHRHISKCSPHCSSQMCTKCIQMKVGNVSVQAQLSSTHFKVIPQNQLSQGQILNNTK